MAGADCTQIKACCSAAYGQDAVAPLLGEFCHPGGLALTRRLVRALGPRPGQHAVDVVSGPGATARLLATGFRVTVEGGAGSAIDRGRGITATVRFCPGDAERLPPPEAVADAVA